MANLYGFITERSQCRMLGERFSPLLKLYNKSGPSVFAILVSASFTIYDSATPANVVYSISPVLNFQSNSDGTMQFYGAVDARPAQTITTAGTYKYVFSIKTSDGDVSTFEQVALINSNP